MEINPILMSGLILVSASSTTFPNIVRLCSGPLRATSRTAESSEPPPSNAIVIIPMTSGHSFRSTAHCGFHSFSLDFPSPGIKGNPPT